METHSESKNGTRILVPEWNPIFCLKTEPRFNKLLEPCFQNENEPQKWFARTRRGGLRETIIGDQKWTLYVRQANQPRRALQIRVWQSLWLALLPRGGGLPGAQRARVPRRAAAIPRTAAAPSGSPRDGKATCLRQLHIAPCAHTVKRECTTARVAEQCARAAAYASLHAYDKLLLVKSEGIQLCGTVGDGSSLKRGTTLQLQNWTSKLKRGNQQLATNLSAPAG